MVVCKCGYWAGGGGCDAQRHHAAPPKGVSFRGLDVDPGCSGGDGHIRAAESGGMVK